MTDLGITWPGYEGEPRHFTGVPGVYGPGVVVALSETGRTADELRELLAGTPLELVEIPAPEKAAEPKAPKARKGGGD